MMRMATGRALAGRATCRALGATFEAFATNMRKPVVGLGSMLSSKMLPQAFLRSHFNFCCSFVYILDNILLELWCEVYHKDVFFLAGEFPPC